MNTATWNLVILAQRDRWERLGDRFRAGHRVDWDNLIIWGGLIALVVVAMILLSRHFSQKEPRRGRHNPHALFHELCRAHGLDRGTRRLLMRLAVANRLENPASVFLEPDQFAREQLPDKLRSKSKQYANLRDRLFEAKT